MFSSLTSYAQVVELSNAQVQYEETLYPSIRAVINPEPKEVKKAWSDYMQDEFDLKMKGFGFLANKDVLSAEESQLPSVSSKTLNFYTKIIQTGEETSMEVFAGVVGGSVIDPNKDSAAFQTMRTMTISFLDEFLTEYYRKAVEQKQEEVNDLSDDISDLKSDIEKAENRIDKLTREIQDLKSEIEEDRQTILEKEEQLLEEKTSLEMKKKEQEIIRKKMMNIKS